MVIMYDQNGYRSQVPSPFAKLLLVVLVGPCWREQNWKSTSNSSCLLLRSDTPMNEGRFSFSRCDTNMNDQSCVVLAVQRPHKSKRMFSYRSLNDTSMFVLEVRH